MFWKLRHPRIARKIDRRLTQFQRSPRPLPRPSTLTLTPLALSLRRFERLEDRRHVDAHYGSPPWYSPPAASPARTR